MGSPSASVLAKIIMGFYKSKWLNEYNLNKPKLYLRYVDDVLATFEMEQDSLNFLNFLNDKHRNIKFTIEKQVNHSIAFLDAFISGIDDQNLTLQTYHKSTYTGLLLNFKSFMLFSYKISLIKKCLIDKCSSNKNQLKETSGVYYFKLSYIGNLSHHIKNKFSKLCK